MHCTCHQICKSNYGVLLLKTKISTLLSYYKQSNNSLWLVLEFFSKTLLVASHFPFFFIYLISNLN